MPCSFLVPPSLFIDAASYSAETNLCFSQVLGLAAACITSQQPYIQQPSTNNPAAVEGDAPGQGDSPQGVSGDTRATLRVSQD